MENAQMRAINPLMESLYEKGIIIRGDKVQVRCDVYKRELNDLKSSTELYRSLHSSNPETMNPCYIIIGALAVLPPIAASTLQVGKTNKTNIWDFSLVSRR